MKIKNKAALLTWIFINILVFLPMLAIQLCLMFYFSTSLDAALPISVEVWITFFVIIIRLFDTRDLEKEDKNG